MGLFDKIIKAGKDVASAVEKAATPTQSQPANTAANQTASLVTPPTVQAAVTQNSSDDPALVKWDVLLPQYPKWCFGGNEIELDNVAESVNVPFYSFNVYGVGRAEVEKYSQLLKQNGFRPAGKYPDEGQLYKRVGDTVYNADIEHAFDGGSEYISLGFTVREPEGGFDYQK